MKAGLEPPSRAGDDDVMRALASIIATTRLHWSLPTDRRTAPGAGIGVGIAYAAQARSGPEPPIPWPGPPWT